ncbi:hypothetical protein C0J52_00237 [Blattella germanica]|nr:hypothetical protein C0J52_00237 [Blattella germanica]
MCTMSTLVFEWTRTVISQRYLDSICLESNIDKHDVIKDMALTAKVKVEWDSNGQIFLEGDWKQLMAIHVSLVKWKQDEEANRTPPSQSLESVAVVEPPIPKTNTQNVLRYIKQKYLNASRRRSSLLSSKKVVPELEKEMATSELVQENEVYVNITVSDGDLSKISSLFGSGQELPYQVSLSTSDLLVPNKESLSTDSIKQETCSELSTNSNNENKNFIEKTLGVNNWEEGDLPNVKPEKPSYPLSDCESLEKSVASISEPVTKTFAKKKDYEKLAPFKFFCKSCSFKSKRESHYQRHLELHKKAVHSNVRAFLCEICGSSFKTRAVQRKHVLTIHKNPKAFSCLQCSRKFNTKYALRRHMKQHRYIKLL